VRAAASKIFLDISDSLDRKDVEPDNVGERDDLTASVIVGVADHGRLSTHSAVVPFQDLFRLSPVLHGENVTVGVADLYLGLVFHRVSLPFDSLSLHGWLQDHNNRCSVNIVPWRPRRASITAGSRADGRSPREG
jgi:hypothetical protein